MFNDTKHTVNNYFFLGKFSLIVFIFVRKFSHVFFSRRGRCSLVVVNYKMLEQQTK